MSENATISPGTILAGRYQVRRELGRGGMGVVYLCRDLVVDERVAMKLLSRPGAKTRPEDAWWFHEEARALAGLNHPAIVRARDFGTLADGTPYLVMDAVPGRSLHEWIYLAHTDGLLPWPIVWTTVDQVLSALAHAHARGVVHGDLKPSNVLVDIPVVARAEPGRNGRGGPAAGTMDPTVHVLDLGLAWLIQDRVDHRLDGSPSAEPTVRWGAGTPGWMAPEQIRLAAPHVGPATDLYSLGCILFALLSDREPYAGSNEELLAAHRNAPIPEPNIPPGVPREVAPFVMRLLAKRPWHRFDFAGDARRIWRQFKPTSAATGSAPVPRGAHSVREVPSREEITMPDTVEVEFEPPTTTAGLLGLRPSPLVARNDERARLLNLAADVVEGNPAHRFVLLAGEAGVGKSRLAEWLCEEVHERALMIPLRARYRKIAAPLDGVVGAVTQYYRLERAERDVVEKVLLNVWGVEPDDDEGLTWVAAAAEWIRPAPPGAQALGPTGKRFALDRPELRWLVVRRTLERIAKNRPILLWLDDLHYASATTFEGLAMLHREANDLRLLVVATMRSEAVESDAGAAERLDHAVRELGGDRIDIAPLDAAHTHSLLRETLPLDDAAVTEAAARSKGNPLFALQIVHAWAMGGHLELKEGRYVVPPSALAARAPTTAELWEERVQALPEDLRSAALAAAALGGDIRRDILSEQLSLLGIDSERAVSAMKRAQILLASGADRVRWPHALLQEHLLTKLFLQANSAQVFRAAADALAHHPAAGQRRILRHRVVNLTRAGDLEAAASLLHGFIASLWAGARDVSATLRDLALLDGKLDGRSQAMHLRWHAEALRHAGRLEDARREAEAARNMFHAANDVPNKAHCLPFFLGHIASDLAAPAHGRRLVARALSLFEEIGDDHGRAQCEVVLGEIDYLLGDHGRARNLLAGASLRFLGLDDRLGRAQCLVLQSFVEQAGGSPTRAREMTKDARREFDGLGYRLGIAQCDVSAAHSDHREGKLEAARATALTARQSFIDLAVPRGEAASERVLAMIDLDSGDADAAQAHAQAAAEIYDRLADPWGRVMRLVLAQIALDRGLSDRAREHLIACEAVALAEAEPKQHRHLTLAWLAYHEGRFNDAARELDLARSSFKDASRTGDHTPQLLERFAGMGWPKPARERIVAWKKAITTAGAATYAVEIMDEETIPLPRGM